jgi:transposase
LEKIQQVYAEKCTIHLIIDNAKYYHNQVVTDYLQEPTCRIHVIFLPAYSPNLNFIERLWKFLKKYIIGVKYREKFKQFEEDIREFLDNMDPIKNNFGPLSNPYYI